MRTNLNKHYVIEFLGLPGAGKSTLAFEIIEGLKNNRYTSYNHDQIFKNANITNKWLSALVYYIKNLRLVLYLLLYAFFSSPRNIAIKRYNISRFLKLLELIVMYEMSRAKKKPPSLMIFDQGIIQCIWSITSKGGSVNKNLLKKSISIKKHLVPDIIIYVDTHPGTAAARIKERKSKCVFNGFTLQETGILFIGQESKFKDIMETLKEVKALNVLVVEGSGSFNENTKTITKSIKAIIEEEL